MELNEVIGLPTSDGMSMMQVGDIVYAKSDRNHTTVYLSDDRKVHANKNLAKFVDFLPKAYFCHTHKQYLVNKDFIISYNKKDAQLLLKNGTLIPVSERKKKSCLGNIKQL